MGGTSSPHVKLAGDFGNAIEVIRIGDCFPFRDFAKNLWTCNFGLLQHIPPASDRITAWHQVTRRAKSGNHVAFHRHGNWDSFGGIRGYRHEISPPTFSASSRRCCRVPGCVAYRRGANLSGPARTHHPWFSGRQCIRHRCTPYGSIVVGAAWATIYRREPAGGQQQYRHRGGRKRKSGRLHAPHGGRDGERNQREALSGPQIQFRPGHRASREHWRGRLCHGGKSIDFSQGSPGVHRLRQGQSGKINMASPVSGPRPMSSASCS